MLKDVVYSNGVSGRLQVIQGEINEHGGLSAWAIDGEEVITVYVDYEIEAFLKECFEVENDHGLYWETDISKEDWLKHVYHCYLFQAAIGADEWSSFVELYGESND
jgi:hypothetical protein